MSVFKLMSIYTHVTCWKASTTVATSHCNECRFMQLWYSKSPDNYRNIAYPSLQTVWSDTAKLCSSGLALVTKQCHKLLMNAGGFRFERCPEFYSNVGKPVESYWLIGPKSLTITYPH